MQPIPPGFTLSCASRNPSHAPVSSATNAFVNEFIAANMVGRMPSARRTKSKRSVPIR
jgi:hypothetical protein